VKMQARLEEDRPTPQTVDAEPPSSSPNWKGLGWLETCYNEHR
jgi:hypothetical protein